MAEGRHQHTLPNGYQFEGYRIDGVLGAGGFGITYKATEVAIDRPVAIKEFLPGGIVMRDPDRVSVRPVGPKEAEEFAYGLSRFRQEAQTLVRFRHPNIVTLHRYLEAHGTAYLVMNFEDGESLGNILRREHTLTESELREILDPILDGLKEVHEAGFLHRDIKPDNIYVRRDGSPVLLDFGAARQALGERSQSLTSIFTSGYAPLEQYSTRGGHGPWTDIYGLAASVYRAMTGIKPPPAPDRVRDDPYRPAREAAKGRFSPEFLAAIDRALALHPEDRPQSVEAFRRALGGRALHLHGTAARPRSRLPWAAAALIVLAGTGGTAYYIADQRASSPSIAVTPRHLAAEQQNAKGTRLEQEEAQRRAAAERKRLEEAAARERADAEAKRKAEEDARHQAEAAAKRRAEEDARRQAEAAARRNAEEDARRQAEAAAKRKAEEDARREAEAAAKRKAEEDARREAEAAAKRKAEEDAKRQAEAAAKRKAEEDARRQAEAAAKRKAEEDARRQTEAAAKRKAEAETKRKVEAQARERDAAERARREKEARKVAGGPPSPAATGPQLARRTPGPTVGASNLFSGRTAFFARLSTAKQATLRIRLVFRADGGLEAQCLAEAPDGKTAPCEPNAGTAGPGRWSFVDKQLCLSAAVLGLNGRHCYAISGAGPQYTAAGSGVLAGGFMLR